MEWKAVVQVARHETDGQGHLTWLKMVGRDFRVYLKNQ